MIDRTDFEMKLRRDASSDVLEVSRHDLMHGFGDATKNPVQGQTNAQHDIRSMSSSRLLGDVQAAEDVADADIAMLLLLKSISGGLRFLSPWVLVAVGLRFSGFNVRWRKTHSARFPTF